MLDCSTAHTFLYRWFVLLVRTPSNQKLALRLVMESLLTHSLRVTFLTKVLDAYSLTQTVTTAELKLQTSCNSYYISNEGGRKTPFFIGGIMELKKPLMHIRLHQLKFFWWDPRIDPREPEYWGPDGGSFLMPI